MLVQIVIFSIFDAKKLKKARNLQQISEKNSFFEFAPERWSTVLYPKNELFPQFYFILPDLNLLLAGQPDVGGRQ